MGNQPKTSNVWVRHWALDLVLGLAAFGLTYLLTLRAMSTGSLLEYGAALIALYLGVRGWVRASRKIFKR